MIKENELRISTNGFLKCCAEEIRRLWVGMGGSMNIVNYTGVCPKCNHFIGITQTPEKEANEFLEKYDLEQIQEISVFVT